MLRYFLAALLLLTVSAEAQISGSSTVELTPATLTAVSNVFTPSCPTLGAASNVSNIIVTAASQSIALPTCPSSSINLFVTFNICNGKSGTAPCNGTASGPFSPGISFGGGFEFAGNTPYAVSSGNKNNVSGAKDIVTCEVMGTTGPWSCGAPQYAEGAPSIITDVWQTPGGGNCSSSVALSGGNLTASVSTGSSFVSCRATNSHTTGKFSFFATVVAQDDFFAGGTISGWVIGVMNASGSLSNYVGSDANSVGFQPGNATAGFFLFNGTSSNTGTPVVPTGTIVRVDVDLTNKQMGINVSGTEYPTGCTITTPSGCYPFAAYGGAAAFPAWTGNGPGVADTVTLNTTSGSIPAGFSLWQ